MRRRTSPPAPSLPGLVAAITACARRDPAPRPTTLVFTSDVVQVVRYAFVDPGSGLEREFVDLDRPRLAMSTGVEVEVTSRARFERRAVVFDGSGLDFVLGEAEVVRGTRNVVRLVRTAPSRSNSRPSCANRSRRPSSSPCSRRTHRTSSRVRLQRRGPGSTSTGSRRSTARYGAASCRAPRASSSCSPGAYRVEVWVPETVVLGPTLVRAFEVGERPVALVL
ncbi:MAG: hypothetical protein R3F34_16940 [Planctomycetota bacterium]